MEKYQYTAEERALMESSQIPFAVYQFIDRRVVTLVLSDGFCQLFGYDDRAQAYYDMDNDMYKDAHPDDVARIADAAVHFATKGGHYETIYRSRNRNGKDYNVIHAQGEHVYTPTGVRLAHIWYTNEGVYNTDGESSVLNELLNKALRTDSMLAASYYDQLTGLPNMTHFFDLAQTRRNALLAEGRHPVMLFIDFCGMKTFNQKYGFGEGDKLLIAFARLLAQTFGNENCGRLGQDHFAAVTVGRDLENTLNRLFADTRALNGGRSLPVHVGIHDHRVELAGPSTACDRAKLACDALGGRYDSCFNYYDDSMRAAEEQRQYILDNLDRALAERWIRVYYQPIVRAVNGLVCEEEALARWIDPERGLLSPGEFIPILEDARLIYKLDLYVVDRVLEKLKNREGEGRYDLPQSVNLSRSDFEACDMVEEIRARTDAAGVDRSLVTVEITESVIGADFAFMKEQVERFQALGFPVWMDDFGSGYSSLDVLQSIRFQLIKFDMHFMRQFDQGEGGRIILTELMKMAMALGLDTVCEGVETEEQVRFLQEIGCSKLQGFYYAPPQSPETIREHFRTGRQIGQEDPRESRYYEAIGGVNLYDPAVVAQEDEGALRDFFDAIPMAVMELRGSEVKVTRSNQSYRDFLRRRLSVTVDETPGYVLATPKDQENVFYRQLKQCCEQGGRAIVEETTPDGKVIHSLLRRLGVNPVTGTAAVAIAVLSVVDADQSAIYANITRALAADYFNLFYVDLETEKYIEYSSDTGAETLAVERRGENFFTQARKDALTQLYPEDRPDFDRVFSKDSILRELDEQGTFTLTYRLLQNGKPVYMNMKVMPMLQDRRYIIIGVSSIDSQMKQKELLDKARQDQILYSRILALSGNYICLYTVDLETGRFNEYTSTDDFRRLGIDETGDDFFRQSYANAQRTIVPEDLALLKERLTRENVLAEIRRRGRFELRYNMLLGGKPVPTGLNAALVTEGGEEKLIVGIFLRDTGE